MLTITTSVKITRYIMHHIVYNFSKYIEVYSKAGQGCPTFSDRGPVCNFQLGPRATNFFLFLKSIFKIHKTSAGYMYYNYKR